MRSSSERAAPGRVARLWPAAWVLTSGALIAVATQVDHGAIAAGAYVGANGLTLLVEAIYRPRDGRFMVAFGWVAACQLPVLLWLLFGPQPDEFRVTADPAAGDPTRWGGGSTRPRSRRLTKSSRPAGRRGA